MKHGTEIPQFWHFLASATTFCQAGRRGERESWRWGRKKKFQQDIMIKMFNTCNKNSNSVALKGRHIYSRLGTEEMRGVWSNVLIPLSSVDTSPPGENSAALCGPAWHSLPLSPSARLIVCRDNMPPPQPRHCSHQPLVLSVTVRVCFSMISRLISGEISSLMVVLEWWIPSLSLTLLYIDFNIMA